MLVCCFLVGCAGDRPHRAPNGEFAVGTSPGCAIWVDCCVALCTTESEFAAASPTECDACDTEPYPGHCNVIDAASGDCAWQ